MEFVHLVNLDTVSDFSVSRLLAVYLVNKFYPSLVDALNTAANCTVHRVKSNIYKHWWSEDLQQEKQRSIDSHHMWVGSGRPSVRSYF